MSRNQLNGELRDAARLTRTGQALPDDHPTAQPPARTFARHTEHDESETR
jgi:hypothetical protein